MDEGTGLLVITRPWPGMLRTLYGDDERYVSTYFAGSARAPTWSVTRHAGQRRLLLDHRADRRRHQRLRPPAVHRRGRVRDRRPREGRRGGRGRRGRRADRSGHRRLRDVERHLRGDDKVAASIRTYVGSADRQAGPAEVDHLGEDLPKTRSGKIMRRLLVDIAEGRSSATSPRCVTRPSSRTCRPRRRARHRQIADLEGQP